MLLTPGTPMHLSDGHYLVPLGYEPWQAEGARAPLGVTGKQRTHRLVWLFLCPCNFVTYCCIAGPDFTGEMGVTNRNYDARRGRCRTAQCLGFPQTPKAKHKSHLSAEGMSTSLGGLCSGPPFPKSLPPPLNLLDESPPHVRKAPHSAQRIGLAL